jgi:UDP-N-acetyl-D-glucosamine dehydrogenase
MTTTLDLTSDLQSRIAARTATIGIVGMGYVGLPLALLFSEQGFSVTGFDIDAAKVSALNAGGSYIVRIPATEIQSARGRGFSATSDYAAVRRMDAVIICVPTPLDEFHEPDLSFITGTARAIAPHLRQGQLVILESTTYPGTTEELLIPLLESGNLDGLVCESAGAAAAPGFYVAFSPEREDPGNDTVARRDIPKVIGGIGPVSQQLACALYGSIFNRTIPVSTPAAAEMTKLLENIYRCVNIALVNELKLLCLRMNLDIWEVIGAAKTKPFGFQAFYPGPGLGGHCIPIDPFYLSWKTKQAGIEARFIELAGYINGQMPHFVVDKIQNALNDHSKPVKGSHIHILGVAYKRDIDDVRESPALDIILLLERRGARVTYSDPFVPKIRLDGHELTAADPNAMAAEADCVVVVTDHAKFDYPAIVKNARLIVDTRNALKKYPSPKVVRL